MGDIVDSLWGDYTPGVETSPLKVGREINNNLDKDAFLTLLLTQMKYQDPLNPMDDKEFVAQMAQFTALEQMQNLNQSSSNTQAFSMIGKTVYGKILDEASNTYTEITGRVESVRIVSGEAILMVDGKDLKLSEVQQVFEDYQQWSIWNSLVSNTGITTMQNLASVGDFIQGLLMDEDYNVTSFIEGRVDYIKYNDGTPVFVVGGQEISPLEVINVSDRMQLIGSSVSAYTDSENSEEGRQAGEITGINIKNNKAYVVFFVEGNGEDIPGATYEIPIDKIDKLTQAIKSIGSTAVSSSESGVISEVLIKDNKPYVIINGSEVDFDDIAKIE